MVGESSAFAGATIVSTAGIRYDNKQDVRFELALETAEAYRDIGLPYVVVDASPRLDDTDTWVADAHTKRGAIVLPAMIAGIASQRQQGVAYAVANGAQKIVGQEPEKVGLAQFADDISCALDDTDVLVIGRTEASKNSLPPVQRRTETLAGWILEQTHALPPDSLAGPRGFSVAGAAQLAAYPSAETGMNNWIYLYHTPLAARAAGLAIAGTEVALLYPETMVAEETGNRDFDAKRYDQFRLQLRYMLGRPDVAPVAKRLAERVLQPLKAMPAKPSNEVYGAYFAALEADVASLQF